MRRTWPGATCVIRRLDGRQPYSTVRAKPGWRWLYQPVMVPWQTPPQSRVVAGRPSSRATRRANVGPLDGDVDAVQRLVERQHVVRPHPRQERHHRPRLRLRGGLGAGVVRAGQRRPVVRVVAVEVDAVGVAAGPVRQAVGVVRRHHPQVDAVHRLAVAQGAQDRGRRAARCRACRRSARPSASCVSPRCQATIGRPWTEFPMTTERVRRLDRLRLGRGCLRTREHGGREGDRQRET